MKSWFRGLAIVGSLALAAVFIAHRSTSAQGDISPEVLQQIGELLREKQARTPAQRKLGSQLVYARKESLKERLTASIDVMPSLGALDNNASGVLVDVRTQDTGLVSAAINQLGGAVLVSSTNGLRARVPLDQLEALAALPAVQTVKPAARARNGASHLPRQFQGARKTPLTLERLLGLISPVATLSAAGSLTTQGDIAHNAKAARTTYGVDGSPIRVGVLSDSAEATASLIASGDLPPGTTIVQEVIDGPGSSEGTAMMEIVYDLAPGVQLFFASAFNGPDSFADNIRTLRNTYHCDVIVDDVSYSDESPFQDSVIARAVNDVTAAGAVYFSSAGNGGNVTNGTSSAWEGDFVDGGSSASFPGYRLHSFGAQTFNRTLTTTGVVDLFWSDPLGASSNDYDLFVTNAAGTSLIGASTSDQSGTGDPFEEVYRPAGYPANSRIIIAAFGAAAPRALHLDLFFGEPLQISTSGVSRGHNAGASTMGVAAVAWNSARTGTKPFVGGAKNPTEVFSSDGPRKIFYSATGTALTPGNLLFATNGGTTLVKPDIAAADGVTTRTPGFNPFFGTSAAAPHAAGIAALILSKNPLLTVNQVKNLMRSTALDIRAAGIDRDSGYGLVMATNALAAVP